MDQAKEKPYFVYENLPRPYQGADMYPVLHGKTAEEIRATKRIECYHSDKQEVDFIGFAPVCAQAYKVTVHPIAQFHCGGSDVAHGHFILWGGDGTAIVPLMIESYSFFNFIVDNLPRICYEVKAADVEAVKQLLNEKGKQLPLLMPTEQEMKFMNNPALLKEVADSIYYMDV